MVSIPLQREIVHSRSTTFDYSSTAAPDADEESELQGRNHAVKAYLPATVKLPAAVSKLKSARITLSLADADLDLKQQLRKGSTTLDDSQVSSALWWNVIYFGISRAACHSSCVFTVAYVSAHCSQAVCWVFDTIRLMLAVLASRSFEWLWLLLSVAFLLCTD